MKYTIWKKYESNGNDGFPNGLNVELCEGLGKEVKFDKKYCEFYFNKENEENQDFVIGVDGKKLEPPNGLTRSCEWVEEKIFKDCKEQTWRAVDILRILAWKTNKIDHYASRDTKPVIKYYKNWEEGKTENSFVSLQIPYQSIVTWDRFKPVASCLLDIRKKYCESKDAQSAWDSILNLLTTKENKAIMRGIGTVYLITLLHFITDGEFPIYDRFAMASLAVWKLKTSVKEDIITDKVVVRGCELPSKDSNAAKNILESGIYADYIKLLKEFCKANYGNENEWKANRDVDRALWVFGHFFEVGE